MHFIRSIYTNTSFSRSNAPKPSAKVLGEFKSTLCKHLPAARVYLTQTISCFCIRLYKRAPFPFRKHLFSFTKKTSITLCFRVLELLYTFGRTEKSCGNTVNVTRQHFNGRTVFKSLKPFRVFPWVYAILQKKAKKLSISLRIQHCKNDLRFDGNALQL